MADALWVALSLSRYIGAKTMRALLRHFDGDLRAIFAADEAALRRVSGVGPAIARDIRSLDPMTTAWLMDSWRQEGVHILTWDDTDYPPALRTIGDEPPTLFLRGNIHFSLWHRSAAVVGTRRPSPRAAHIAQQMGARLAQGGYTVVSGLAYGIDKAAHEGALTTAAGRALAVLGCGVLNIYPSEHQPLAARIRRQGALLSETSPDAPPNAPRLVARNRLITGLATDGVIIIETDLDGGAMHAARRAREQQRPLFVVDLPAMGNQSLLRDGATPLRPDFHDWPFAT